MGSSRPTVQQGNGWVARAHLHTPRKEWSLGDSNSVQQSPRQGSQAWPSCRPRSTRGGDSRRIGRKLLHRQTKTDASDASLSFPEIVTTALRTRQRVRDTVREAAGDDWQEAGLVFTTASGRPIEPSNFRRSFANACAKAGVRRVHVHATRKTCASLLVALDVHPRVAMRILRHSRIAVTMNIYSEVSSEETRKALKRLGQHLGF
ncbi:site-specific integrase [Nonomuraea sp. NPDC003707]